MPANSKYPRSKTRDFEVPAVKGAATRSYETAPSGGSAQKARGNGQRIKIKTGKIPNKF